MKKIYIIVILFSLHFSCFLFLSAQNTTEHQLALLSDASQIIFYNSTAAEEIAKLREAEKIVREIKPVADALRNKTIDKNLQKRINAQTAIKNKIGELTGRKGFEYIKTLYYLAREYDSKAYYEGAVRLYNEALSVLSVEHDSEQKTKWNYLMRDRKSVV